MWIPPTWNKDMAPTPADQQIMADPDKNFRVYDASDRSLSSKLPGPPISIIPWAAIPPPSWASIEDLIDTSADAKAICRSSTC